MTEPEDTHTDKGRSSAFKVIAAVIPLMAAVVPIIGAFEHWFGGGESSRPPSTTAEYAAVCTVSNARQREGERQLTKFKETFEHAPNVTGARDAMLLLTRQQIASDSEIENDVQALTPLSSEAVDQHKLEADLSANVGVLGKYAERLDAGVSSVAQLVRIAASLRRSAIESRTADARGDLLRLGAPACDLDQIREQPVTRWPVTLVSRLTASTRSGPTGSTAAVHATARHAPKTERSPEPASEASQPAPETPQPLEPAPEPAPETPGASPKTTAEQPALPAVESAPAPEERER